MSKDTSGPAFPIHDPFIAIHPRTDEEAKRLARGMSLRQYIAIKAMAANITSWKSHLTGYTKMQMADLAKASYAMADAMLVEGEAS